MGHHSVLPQDFVQYSLCHGWVGLHEQNTPPSSKEAFHFTGSFQWQRHSTRMPHLATTTLPLFQADSPKDKKEPYQVQNRK